jgi:hypothetical protein
MHPTPYGRTCVCAHHADHRIPSPRHAPNAVRAHLRVRPQRNAMMRIATGRNADHGTHCDAWRAHTQVRPYHLAMP